MPTEILYQTWSGGSGVGDPRELIGYCKESPPDVLQEIFQTHAIHNFKNLYRPVDWDYPNNCSGLILIESEAPAGTSITGTLKDLDLSRGRVELDSPRTEETYKHALKAAIEWHLDDYRGEQTTNYLDTRDQEKDERLERYITQLLEVAQVTLGIKEPTVEDLKRVLRGE